MSLAHRTPKDYAVRRAFWRVRTGDFRIVYTVEDEKLLVVVVIAGNRKDIYGKLRRAGLIDSELLQ